MNSSEEHQKYIQSQQKKQYTETQTTEYVHNNGQNQGAVMIAVPRSDISRQADKVLSPMIFIKRKYKTKQENKCTRRLAVLENMLSIVAQAYYKSDYEIESVMKLLKTSPPELVIEDNKNANMVRKPSKKQSTGNAKMKNDSEDGKMETSEGNKFMDGNDVLEYLVSPLKHDFEFGKLIRKLVA